jgi:hypothetical protein
MYSGNQVYHDVEDNQVYHDVEDKEGYPMMMVDART